MALPTLRIGTKDQQAAEAWETFLTGQGFYWIEVDGVFNQETHDATVLFQKEHGLTADGVVGAKTYAEALKLGFPGIEDETEDEAGPHWPPKPSFGSLSYVERVKVFGQFAFKDSPTGGNPEAITITDGWDKKNIETFQVPQLEGVKGAGSGWVSFHQKGKDQFLKLWADWEAAGLLNLILTFDGAWVARYVRGSRTYLSNHSFGSAFDINARWNPLGAVPALSSKQGTVRPLVEIANQNGFFWGGHFPKRLDGMHFELAKVIP